MKIRPLMIPTISMITVTINMSGMKHMLRISPKINPAMPKIRLIMHE